jgi:DNA repair protein SbcC/Rad50
MRPLSLKLSGLRSYRREQSLDFGDGGLMAIVGDTGAGKSSLLDGIFFALYGGCTWDRRAVVPLIADGETTMQVELLFIAEGRRWKVFRSASRTGTATRAVLVCLDDPAERYDNSDPVTTKIRELVGLDDDAFLRTVILPQGRFQALLQATKGDRTAILKGIFRLEQLEAVRSAADHAARRIRPGVSGLREERAGLLPDPAAALAEAEARQKDARDRQDAVKALAGRIATLEQEAAQVAQQAGALQRLVTRVEDEHRPETPTDLERLASRAEALDAEMTGLDTQLAGHRTRIEELEAILRDADAEGIGVRALAAASATLEALAIQLPGLAVEIQACSDERQTLVELEEKVKDDDQALAELQIRLASVRSSADGARSAARKAAATLDEASRALAAAREAHRNAAEEAGVAREADAAVEPARIAVEQAEGRLREAIESKARAEDDLAAIRRANAAAHAAEASHPGEPCPICERPLPSDFARPEAPGDQVARTALAEAEDAVGAARTAVEKAKGVFTRFEEAARQAHLRREGSATTATSSLEALRILVPNASLDEDDASLLAGLVASANRAEEIAAQSAGEQSTLEQEEAAGRSSLDANRRELQRRTKESEARQAAAEERTRTMERSAEELPLPYRPALPLDAANLATLAKAIQGRRAELDQVGRELDGLRTNARALELQRSALVKQRRYEVEEPAGQLDRQLITLAGRLADLFEGLGQPGLPARPEGGPADQKAWAQQLDVAVHEACATARDRIKRSEDQIAELHGTTRLAMEEQGFDSQEALGEAQIEAAAELARATEDAATARQHLPRAKELEEVIGKAGGLLEALDELTKLLTDGRFIGRVVVYKQRTLLAVASEILGRMTENRYGFSEDFEIIDRLTGLPRGVKTLSGGETFLASLALALGLVELAGRGGGRLDALFLDEGFGSLDANSLAEALDALGQQAEGGRLVVVISHLRAVAEAMEHLVAVTRGPEGSRIRALSGTDRDQMVEDEIEAGLLS